MQNIANTGRATFRSGSGAERWLRAAAASFVGMTGMYIWSKDSESSFWTQVGMPIYRRFALDEEYCLNKVVWWLRKGKGPFDYSYIGETLKTPLFGKELSHPIMLGAGLDRNGECIFGCFGLGFSGVELGSVTPQKQAGAGLPRVFKLRADQAIISRAGNPNRGLPVVAYFVEQHRLWEENNGFQAQNKVLGVNVAKNRVSDDITDDARIAVKVMSPSCDYIAVTLQPPKLVGESVIKDKRWLEDLVHSCHRARDRLPEHEQKPILFKVPLDMTETDKKILTEVSLARKVDGFIVGTGSIKREGMMEFHHISRQPGLCYGSPIKDMSTELIRDLYKRTKGKMTIIGGGGVFTGRDALDKIEAGATAIQIQSALVFNGPGIVPQIKRELALALEERGHACVTDAIGSAVKM